MYLLVGWIINRGTPSDDNDISSVLWNRVTKREEEEEEEEEEGGGFEIFIADRKWKWDRARIQSGYVSRCHWVEYLFGLERKG